MRFNDELKVFCYIATCITFLETLAILKGFDGVIFASSMGGLSAVGGFILNGYLKGPPKKKV